MSDYGSQLPPPSGPPPGAPPPGWPPPQSGWPPQQGAPPGWGPPPQGYDPQGYPPYPNPEEMGGPAWEHREQLGLVTAFVRTFREVLFEPGNTFLYAKRRGGMGSPLAFYVISATIFTVIQQVISHFVGGAAWTWLQKMVHEMPNADPKLLQAIDEAVAANQGNPLFLVLLPFLMPFFAILGAYFRSAVIHFCLMITGGANRDFESTFRTMCYSDGACNLLVLIPCCGLFLTFVWSMTVSTIGLQRMHQTDTWRALLAVLLPMLACCCMAAGLVFLIFGLAAASQGAGS